MTLARFPRRAARALLAGAALLSLASPAIAAEDERGIGVRLLEAPVERAEDPRASASVIDHVEPGDSFTRRLQVVNDTSSPLTIRTYAGSGQVVDGSFVDDPGRGRGDVARWATIDPGTVLVPARGTHEVRLTIDVPEDAPDGERYGVAWAEVARTTGGITQVNRIGVRIYLSVGTGTEPASDFAIEDLRAGRAEDGRPVVEATVVNTGGRALDMTGSLSLTKGPGGLSAGPFPAELGTTLGIGQSSPVTVVLDQALPAGPWDARIDLSSGLLERAAEATITFPDAAGQAGPRVEAEPVPLAEDPNVVIPIAIGLLILAALMLLWLLLRKRRRRTDDDDEHGEHGDDMAVPAPRRSDEPVRS